MAVAVSGLDLAACDVATVGAAVELVWRCFRGSALDSLVNYYFLQGYAQTTAVGTIKTRVPSLCQRKRTCPNIISAWEKKYCKRQKSAVQHGRSQRRPEPGPTDEFNLCDD